MNIALKLYNKTTLPPRNPLTIINNTVFKFYTIYTNLILCNIPLLIIYNDFNLLPHLIENIFKNLKLSDKEYRI